MVKTVKLKDGTHKQLKKLQVEWELRSIDITIQKLLPDAAKVSGKH